MAPVFDSFPSFPFLPKELRLEIWRYASLFPRIIEISWRSKPPSVVSITAPPPVLHACRESRYEVIGGFDELKFQDSSQVILLHYSLDTIFFGPGCEHLVPSGRTERWTQLNRKLMRDILFSSHLTQNLKVAAFDSGFLLALDDEGGVASMGALYGHMKKLEEVIIIPTQCWEDAKEQCARSNTIGLEFVETKGDSGPYREAKVAYDLSTRRSRHSSIRKIRIAGVEVVKHPAEKPPVYTLLRHGFSIRHQIAFVKHRKLLKIHHRPSSRSPHQPPSYSELST